MRIAIGADHKGFELKERIKQYLVTKGHRVTDFGTSSTESVDYPDFGYKVADAVAEDEVDFGIAICWTGNGINIIANKVKGIRSALCLNEEMASFARQHNDANVLALSSKYVSPDLAIKIVEVWLSTKFEGGRHARRLEKIRIRESMEKSKYFSTWLP